MESKRPVNFPPCPMCRKPITKSVEEVHSLEPARTEEEIAAIVRKYEICGMCNEKENPRKRCADCRKLICGKCISVHRIMKSHYTLEPIIITDEYSQPFARKVCDQHKEQPLDLFCIMCQNVLCSYCTTIINYNHAKCVDKYSDNQVLDRFSHGFLQDFVKSAEARKYSFKTRTLSRFVHIKDFSEGSREWISAVKIKLQDSLSHLREYQQKIRRTKEELNDSEILVIRRQTIIQGVESIQQAGEYLHFKCVNLLSEKTTDFEVATAILELEQLCSWYFISVDDFPMATIPLEMTTEVVGHSVFCILRTVYSCSVRLVTSCDVFASIISVKQPEEEPYQIQTISHNFENNNKTESGSAMDSVRATLRQSFYRRNESFHNRAIFLGKGDNSEWQYYYLPNGMRVEVSLRVNPDCKLVEHTVCRKNVESGSPTMTMRASIRVLGPKAQALPPGSFYIEDGIGDPRICYCVGGPLDHRYGSSDSSLMYTTYFTQTFGPVLSLPIQRAPQTDHETQTVYLNAFVGKSAPFSGLETLFIYFENDINHIHAFSVSACMAKFNLVSNVHPNQQNINCCVEKDEMGIFSLCTVTGDKGELLHSSFRTELSTNTAPENFISISGSDVLLHDLPVSVISYKVDLLCTARQGLYFVKRGLDFNEVDFNTLTIGRLVENNFEIRPETHFSVRHTELGCIQIKDLKPLTIFENRNKEIVVICAFEYENTKFIIISPDKRGAGVIEMVEVKYPSDVSVLNASVIDLEMDLDGNVIYVLENINGTKYSISTKFFTS